MKKISLWRIFYTGALKKCPNCGNNKLFNKYLKQVEHCSSCNEYFGDIHADDGPAWLTLVIIGHLLAPFFLIKDIYTTYPTWACTTVFLSIGIILSLLILPSAKGIFIAVSWYLKVKK